MTNKHRVRVFLTISLCLLGLTFTSVSAQQTPSVRQEVTRRLRSITPKNTNRYVYRVKVPIKTLDLPSTLRLDLVYKIGHYSWDLVALRFERTSGNPYVEFSQVIFSSAFPFIRNAMNVTDSYSVKHGKLSVKEFDRLLSLAYTFYQSTIEAKYVGPSGQGFGSISGSSGDGTILLRLAIVSPHPQTIIRESGTLHVGDLSKRVEDDYEFVKVHLFWQVFHEYLETQSILNDMDKAQAVDLLIGRLKEPPMVDGYKDYFRQSLYVETLGELGSVKAIETLEYVAQSNRLEGDWQESLKRDVSKAIEKIKTNNKKSP